MKFFAVFAAILAVGAAASATTMTTTWTLQELDAALSNPQTNPALIPYLEHALNEYMNALWAGHEIDSIVVPLPAEIVMPIKPENAASITTSPLVQVIVNVNKKSQPTQVEEAVHEPELSPALVEPSPELEADTGSLEPESPVLPIDNFNPIDAIAINPEPVDSNIINPSPAFDIGPM